MKKLLVLLLASTALTAQAQTVNLDTTSLTQRLERIEQRLSVAESRGASAGTSAGGTRGTVPMAGSGLAGTALADMEERMSLLERQGDQVNGGVERLGHAVEQLAKQVDLLHKDFDARLTALEQKSAAAPAVAKPATAADKVDTAAETPTAQTDAKADAKTDERPAVTVPTGLSATEHYNKAYAYLTAADYPNASAWLTEFVKRFPSDKLADNAWYWLGEVHLVQNQPEQALAAFKEGIQKFPKGAKAPSNLYKMGLAFQQLKQNDFAKASWEKLTKDYPNAPETSKAKAKLAELKKAAADETPSPTAPAPKPDSKAETPTAKPASKPSDKPKSKQ